MTQLITFILATAGLTHIVVYSHLFEGFREWFNTEDLQWLYRLFTCPKCAGWWLSMPIYFIIYPAEMSLQFLAFNFIGSLASYVASILIDWLND